MSYENDDKERFNNLILFNFPGTNKEWEEAAPLLGVFILLALLIIIPWMICDNHQKKEEIKNLPAIEKIEKPKGIEI